MVSEGNAVTVQKLDADRLFDRYSKLSIPGFKNSPRSGYDIYLVNSQGVVLTKVKDAVSLGDLGVWGFDFVQVRKTQTTLEAFNSLRERGDDVRFVIVVDKGCSPVRITIHNLPKDELPTVFVSRLAEEHLKAEAAERARQERDAKLEEVRLYAEGWREASTLS